MHLGPIQTDLADGPQETLDVRPQRCGCSPIAEHSLQAQH